MRAILLLNAAAGRIKEDSSLADPAALKQWFETVGVDVEVWSTPAAEIENAARRAADSDVECIIVVGGDGTVRSVAEVLAGGTKPLGVLPAGTLNHFARDLGMPADLDEAIQKLVTAQIDRVDVGEVNGRVFVNNSSVGIYSQMVLQRDALRPASRRHRFVAMLRASWRVLRRFPRFTATIQLDSGEPEARTVPLILISNNPYETGWPKLGRRSDLNQGRLGVYVVRCATRGQLVWCAFQAIRNRLDQIAALESLLASAVAIETERRTVLVSLDGEVMQFRPPLRYRSRARDLLVLRPQAVRSDAPNS